MIGFSGIKGHTCDGLMSQKEPKRNKRKSIDWFGINHGMNIEMTCCKNTV